jgi:simple sugar transport system permease protein
MSAAWRVVAVVSLVVVGLLLSPAALGGAVANATPLVFVAVAFALPKAAGFFNIGAEGQMLWGGLTAALVGVSLPNLPPVLHVGVCCLGAMLAGAAFAALAWLLRYLAGVSEVISTIMLNLIAVSMTTYLVVTVFPAGGIYQSQTHYIASSAEIPALSSVVPWTWIREGRVNMATIVAVILLLAYATYLRGQAAIVIRAAGFSGRVVRASGYSTKWLQFFSVVVAGAVAGLGSIHEVLGNRHAFVANFAFGIGYTGIVVALLCGDSAEGIASAAFLMGLLQYEALLIQIRYNVPQELAVVIQAVLVLTILVWHRQRSLVHG